MVDNVLISQLPAAGALAGADLLEVEQGAAPTNTSGKASLTSLLAFIQAGLTVSHPFSQALALSDLTTALVSGAAVVGAWIPDYAGSVTSAMIAVVMAQSSSGVVTVDCLKNGVTIFSTKPSIDASENTSLTGTPAVLMINPTTFVAGDKFTFVINAGGTGAKGLQITLGGNR
jgi:hypothetical protein